MGRVTLKFEGDASGARRAIRELSRELDGVEEGSERALGGAGQGRVQDFVASVGGIAAAFGAATQAVEFFDQKSQESLSRLEGALNGLQGFAQLASTPQELEQLTSAAQTFSQRSGAELPQAVDAVRSIQSAGLLSEVETFADAQTIGFEAGSTSRAIATLQAAIGRDEAGSAREILSKGLAASKDSPELTGPILEGTARVGGLLRQLGISDEQGQAALSVLATSTGSAERGATQLQALLQSAVEEGDRFQGQSLLQILGGIRSEGIGGKDATGPGILAGLGRIEGFQAFSSLQLNQPRFERVLREVEGAASSDLFGQRVQLVQGSELVGGLTRLERLRRAKEAADQDLGEGAAGGETAFLQRQLLQQSSGPLGRARAFAGEFLRENAPAGETLTNFGADVIFSDQTTQVGTVVSLLQGILGKLGVIADSTNETAKKTGGTVGMSKPGADE